MRKLLLALATASLVVPAGAAAKELTAATICGASGCRTLQHPNEELGGGGDGIPEPAPSARPYYTARLSVAHDARTDAWTVFYVPGAEMVVFRGERGQADFEQLYGRAVTAWQEAVRGLEPFPVPTVTGATVDGRPVADPQSYLSLYGRTDEVGAYPTEPDFVPIVLHAPRPSPWTDLPYVLFSRSAGAIELGSQIVALPRATTEAIAARRSLGGPSREGRGFAWPAVSFALAAALALGLAAVFAVRRTRRAAPA